MKKGRNALIQQKAREIQGQLEQWATESKVLGTGEQMVFTLWVKAIPVVVEKSVEEILSMNLREFAKTTGQSARVSRLYRWTSTPISTVGELIQRSAAELLETRNFGATTLNAIRASLQELGLKLRDD